MIRGIAWRAPQYRFSSSSSLRATTSSVTARCLPEGGETIQRRCGLSSGWVVIDEDQLLDAVRVVNGAGRPVHAENVRKYLGQFAAEGGYFEVSVVAADLEELESLGKLKRAPDIEWNDSGPTPKTRVRYVLPSE